ncbi:hypothetical protein ACIGO8_09835 [Streptomyces sp. NPDC053493]|uniref:hypothetical protein n=1 Tax=Streptomyces sp. NPDC053493 TaxID=3365705 RepID=UPI0037D69906
MFGTASTAAVLVVVAALTAGCGSGAGSDASGGTGGTSGGKAPATGSGTASGSSSGSGTASGSGSGSGEAAGGGAGDFGTVFKTEQRIEQGLPDPASMKGWTPKNGSAEVEEQPKSAAECAGSAADWDCTAIADGSADFDAFGENADFDLTAFADKAAARAACAKEKAWFAKYTKAQVAAVPGAESHAYYRNHGGLDGLNVTLCLGTVVARVRLEGEGSSLDPGTAHTLSRVFVDRIQKAAAAS